MKHTSLFFVCFAMVSVAAWGIWVSHKGSLKTASTNSAMTSSVGVRPPASPQISSTLMKPNEWQQFRSDRETILSTNPDLALTYKAILTEMDDQQKDLE
jgi:hypothetical protein